jgi:hypothetical protein
LPYRSGQLSLRNFEVNVALRNIKMRKSVKLRTLFSNQMRAESPMISQRRKVDAQPES